MESFWSRPPRVLVRTSASAEANLDSGKAASSGILTFTPARCDAEGQRGDPPPSSGTIPRRDGLRCREDAVVEAVPAYGERRPWMARLVRPRSGPLCSSAFVRRPEIASNSRSWRLLWCGIALAAFASGSFEGPAIAQVESLSDGFEVEEIVNEERRMHASRRRLAELRGRDFSAPVRVTPTEVEPALAAHASATRVHDTGRQRRYRHQSLLI